MSGRFSVIVPVYNGEETLEQCLDSLVSQDYPKDGYETIVVNDGSTDKTPEIAQRYPVRLINLQKNQGRVVARVVGAKAARYDLLVFNDVRVIPDSDHLKKLDALGYYPVIVGVETRGEQKGRYDRLFYLLRRWIYRPYYPVEKYPAPLYLGEDNFDRVPKGAGSFVCSKELWLSSQPEEHDKTTNDDTKILANIVKKKRILRSSGFPVRYIQRTGSDKVLSHIFWRGPRFADYYLVHGRRYYRWYLLFLAAVVLVIGLTICQPWVLLFIGGLGLVSLIGFAIYLSDKSQDILVILTFFPPVVAAFGLGIVYGKLVKVWKWLRSWLIAAA